MDLIITSYKSRFRLWIVWTFLVITLFSLVDSWRITQKCPHGHYYNDGCTACWCDVGTGHTRCEELKKCGRFADRVKCPRGRQYKDNCGNDCTCYEATGAVLCNEIRRCAKDVPAKAHTPTTRPTSISDSAFHRRGGFSAPYIPPIEEHPIRLQLPGFTASSPTRSSATTARSANRHFYGNVAIESTPHPHVRIPTSSKSEELIIEPAIIIRKKGSNKASIVRNPSSATSVTLPSSRNRHQDHTITLNKNDDATFQGSSNSQSTKAASLSPLHLYEKQLQTILNIRRAYSQLLRSKVNFNFQIATGNIPLTTTDHPRRFDSDYENSTVLMNTTPTPPVFMTSQQPKPPPNVQVKPFQPLILRKEIKNVLKQFSPVPPLKQFVSYVTTSTENYLRDFLNKNRLQQPILMLPTPEATTVAPPPPPPPIISPQTVHSSSQIPYQFQPFSTIAPFQDHRFDHSDVPIHEVYQNHDFKLMMTTTPQPSLHSSYYGNDNYLHKTLGSQNDNFQEPRPNEEQFPFMNELMQQIARMDSSPNTTPKSGSELTVTPTFSTPGPPYVGPEEVKPLSFLPPPQPEPATPTRRTFTMGQENRYISQSGQHQQMAHPTVRVNLDKPIYINSPSMSTQHRYHPPPPLIQQPHHHQHFITQQRIAFPPQPSPPHQNNRRLYSFPHAPNRYFAPPMQQQHHHHHLHKNIFQPIQRHHTNQQHNVQHRPLFSQYFIPKPKQYRLVLKGAVRDAAVRVDDVVPRFVSKIAHEFFKKPEIYVPKIRPGKPLTLEKVVLNHREIVPTEMSFSPTPGMPPTKLRFTPQAQWEMKEELAKQGIMLDEPLTTSTHSHAPNDPNVMEMDAPMKAVQTWETHSSMGMGTLSDYSNGEIGGTVAPVTSIPQIIQYSASNQQHLYNPILLPSPTPPQITLPPPTLDHQHQQEIQHQLLLAQQRQQPVLTSSSSNDNVFKFDPADFNDFTHDGQGHQQQFPAELQIPGVDQVVVDKYLVHDPMNPAAGVQVFSTTTVQPPTVPQNLNLAFLLSQHRRNGLAALPAHGPTPPPAVLVRHHGAPTPSSPPPTEASIITASPFQTQNFMVTVINSTPRPFVTTTISPFETTLSSQFNGAYAGDIINQTNGASVVSQIQDFLAEEMDFGARPQMNFYDMLFQHRTGDAANDGTGESFVSTTKNNEEDHEITQTDEDRQQDHDTIDQMARETKASQEDPNVDTEKLADIFSMDYKNKYNKKPPAVIVIKVPPDHSDGPFPKVVEKRRGEELEIQGGYLNSKSESTAKGNKDVAEASTENSITRSTSTEKSVASSENNSDDNNNSSSSKEDSSSAKRRRDRKNKKRKRRRRKKKNRNRSKLEEYEREDVDNDNADTKESSSSKSAMEKEEINSPSQHQSSEDLKSNIENKNATSIAPRIAELNNQEAVDAEKKFQAELDWKSQLMANICDLNPSSPLCLTYRSICLLMTSDD